MAAENTKLVYPTNNWYKGTANYIVAAGTTASIKTGEWVKCTGAGAFAAIVDADGTTSQRLVGIASAPSTETASVAGVVIPWELTHDIVFATKAKTAGLANTQALIDALVGKRVIFDVTTGVQSIDTAAADAATNVVLCMGGDPATATIYYRILSGGSFFG
jgi:hypothetical protein